MRRAAAGVGALLLGGCVYLNTLYNARTHFREGERARLAGDRPAAEAEYQAALEKAGRGFRKDSLGGWAYPALLLVGQAHLRLGAPREARAALERVVQSTPDTLVRREARLFLGAALVESGEYAPALQALNRSLTELPPGAQRGEAHLWRARVHLAEGRVDQGWWDLERAVEEDGRLESAAHLERVRWALASDDPARAAQGARGLLRSPGSVPWLDSLAVLVRTAERVWSPEVAAGLLAAARGAPLPPRPRDDLLLLRTGLLLAAGDTLAAETELGAVAQDAGPGAAAARLSMAEVRARRVTELAGLDDVRRVLLPAASDSAVVGVLELLRVIELLVESGDGPFPARFAAAELARDRLGARELARALFRQAARDTTGGPWRGKAALAAAALGDDTAAGEEVRLELLRGRDPYLARARNRYLPSDTLARLDGLLNARLDSVRGWAQAEARRRDVEVRSRAGRS
ncbi:MAG: tetratricopeptide repeat protein [Longimicrobiales bacterium]|nr:tetratricopeptide repeat protein [Longimicrobiales bacterium]